MDFIYAFAQLDNPIGYNSLSEILSAILDFVILVAMPLIILFLVWYGFKFLTAQGNPDSLSKAKTGIVYALLGILIILSAKAIQLAIENTTKELIPTSFTNTYISKNLL